MKKAIAVCVLVELIISMTVFAQSQVLDQPLKEILIKDINFDEWELIPMDKSILAEMKKVKESGELMPFETKGPLYRCATGFLGISGMMVGEAKAVEGNAAFFTKQKKEMVQQQRL